MRTALLCSFILLLCTCGRAQCPASLVINTNQDVVSFRVGFPECTQLPGNLTIKGQAITDLSPLSVLTSIGGNLLIDDLTLTKITGLSNITTVSGDVTLSNCSRLEGDGFPEGLSLNRIGGFLSLDNLPRLTQFIPLNDLNILSSGFGSNVIAASNFAPLSGLTGNMARLEITGNPNLTDLSALEGVALIDVMVITGNARLSDCAIGPVCASLAAGNSATINDNRGDCNSAAVVVQQCIQSCTTPDFDALEAIYNAANGDNWTDNANWLKNCDYCTWFGVTCNVDGRVIGLDLADNGLTGTIAAEVNGLPNLQDLKLNTNALTGGIPDLSGLSQLARLELYNNNLSGTLPNLGSKPDLTLVHLVNNDLSGPIPTSYNAANLRAIQRLFLSGNQLSGELPAELGDLTTLDRLHLFNNDLSGCYPLSYRALCGITSILFNDNQELPDGGSAGWFTEEFCGDGRVCEPCEHPDYEGLMAFYNGLNQLNNNPSFTGWADGADGTDCEPCNWYGVTCDENDRVIGLQFIIVGLTGELVPEISLLTELQDLQLPGNMIAGDFPSEIWALPNLRDLALSNNNLGGTLPDPGNLPNVERVILRNNGFNRGVPAFGSCPKLEVILLDNNPLAANISGMNISPTNMPMLTALDLSSTGLLGELPTEYGDFPTGQLTTFDLSDNKLEGCYPTGYTTFCGEIFDFSDNMLLPDEGSAATFSNQFCANGIGCDDDCHPDYEVLSLIYTQTNGDNWTDNTGWLTDCEVCDWFGVFCNTDGRVTALNLINNNLVGTLPDRMDELVELTGINLSGSGGLTGPIPPSLFELGAISNLVLVDNNLTGEIPDNVGNAVTLQVLQLDNSSDLTGNLPASLFDLTNLERLTLAGCDFFGAIPEEIGQLTNLNFLTMSNNRLDGDLPAEIGALTNLTELYLQSNNLSGELPVELADLTNLTDLLLQQNQFTGCYPAEYSALCGIDRIRFSGNTGLPDGGSADFFENNFCANGETCELVCSPDFDALMALYNATGGANWTANTGWVDGAAGTDCDVCDWFGVFCDQDGRVQQLNLSSNNLTGTLPQEIGDYPELRILKLSFNSLSGELPVEIGNLDKLSDFQASSNDFSGSIPAELFQSLTLDRVILSSNDLTGTFPDLSGALGIQQLYLSGNNLSGPLPEFPNLPEFIQIGISSNSINGTFPASLNATNLPALQLLNLGNCGLTGELPQNISDWANLDEFYLNNNAFTGCYPSDYNYLCNPDIAYSFNSNSGLPDGGSNDFFENTFCATGQTCEEACPTDLTINTDQDLTDFRAQYPNCTMLPGNLTLDGDGITATNQLSVLTAVGGNFEIRNLNLTTIRGITNILTVGGDFIVEDCPNLGTNGFGNDLDLTTIGRDLIISDLPVIENITPLRNLTSVGRDVFIQRIAVTSLSGLQSLSGTLNGLILQDNDNLTDLTALGSNPGGRAATLTSIGSVTVLDNDALTDLEGFEGWMVNGSFTIRDNDLLADCTAQSVCDKIAQNDNLIFISDNAVGCDGVAEVEAACMSALPVRWISFTATAASKYVDLTWVTAEEVNNNYFSVERSADGLAWTELGRVGAGAAYTYRDVAPLNGNNYYRLRQVDHDETFTFSEVRWVSFSETPAAAWPNPFRGEVNLLSAEPDLITVYDINGRAVRQIEHAGGGAQVQRMDLKQGVYLFRFQRSGNTLRVVAR